ncbi:ArsR family transcriptional regulator [Comamonas sp. NLF-1-9]|uniref:VpaChn25_0724 family phage protein n=1 Tax=Comamonas sp. NLF-1-9 TaxID=2853163 RepID=UPI001C45D58D|nr:ArsR family transcriptional regulator [Comamonas sp. NLF-1-9]QXL84126.1 ArsR family transcriptional regulator [Comamonas sp. NLF-1-9]
MKTPTFDEHVAAERRLAILQVLEGSTGYQANEFTLAAVLEDLAHTVSQARLRADLARLEDLGLLQVDSVGGVAIARLRQDGLDAAQGKSTVPGVKRPRPQ